MKYFKVFNTEGEYIEYIVSGITPNVSTLRDSSKTWINPNERDYSKEYFTIESLEDNNTIKMVRKLGGGSLGEYVVDYSTNNGSTWTPLTLVSNSAHTYDVTTLNSGEKVMFKFVSGQFDRDNASFTYFSSDGRFNVYGNLTSLRRADFSGYTGESDLYINLFNGSKVVSAKDLASPFQTMSASGFSGMFYGCTYLTDAPELPATTIAAHCYKDMFSGCTALTNVPSTLPAATVPNEAYRAMFSDCTSLTTAPSLSASTVGENSYRAMFCRCSSLTAAPILSATTIGSSGYAYMFESCSSMTATQASLPSSTVPSGGYKGMFNKCTSLTVTPEISATEVGAEGCAHMFEDCTSLLTASNIHAATVGNSSFIAAFSGCTSLTTVPVLSAMTLGNHCYVCMFRSCASLTTVPSNMLPATTLADYCYNEMFNNCQALTTAPELPARTLATECYWHMFTNCKHLNYIMCLATDISATDCTKWWVRDVAASGTFVKYSTMSDWEIDSQNGIPAGWTVQDYSDTHVTGVTLSEATVTITKGDTIALVATVTPSDAYDKSVTWSTSDSSVATVANGVVTAVGCGEATITVRTNDGGYTAQCVTTVENPVTGVSLNTNILNILTGLTYQLEATVVPSDACGDKSVTWSSNNTSVATVDSTGLVTTVAAGSAIVTVTTTVGSYTATCAVEVSEPVAVTGVTLDKNTLEINTRETSQLVATVLPNNATDKRVTWSTSDDTIATVDSDGVVSGVASGSATITVTTTDGSFTAQCAVTVIHARDYSQEYFTIESLEDDNTISLVRSTVDSSLSEYNGAYSIDNGITWSAFTLPYKPAHDGASEYEITTLGTGEKVMFKYVSGANLCLHINSYTKVKTDGEFKVYGNLASLKHIDFSGYTGDSAVYSRFLYDTKVTSAKDLIFPFQSIAKDAFREMFSGCTYLVDAPELPATTLKDSSYRAMFYGCSSLTTVPSNMLPATNLSGASNCYQSMFNSCSSLTTAPSLPATTLTGNCYAYMFQKCTSLTTPPSSLPATTLYANCYQEMFGDCSGLTAVPLDYLPAMSVPNEAYRSMFCRTSLVVAPSLPATTVGNSSYHFMFGYCPSLTTGPTVLPALIATGGAYQLMFSNCSALTSAPEICATTVNGSACLTMFADCTSLTTAPTIHADTALSASFKGAFSGCTNLTTVQPILSATTVGSDAYFQMFKGCKKLTTAPELPAANLSGASSCYAGMFNECTSLTATPSSLPATTLANNCYQSMFQGCTGLTTAPTSLPAATLSDNCYNNMFNGCKSLSASPEIHAATVGEGSCRQMFQGCTSLTTGPSTLSATTLDKTCYYSMFQGCTGLTTAPTSLPAATLPNDCCYSMFNGCKSLITAPGISATTVESGSCKSMFYNCSGLTTTQEVLSATTVGNSGYEAMFYGCSGLTAAPVVCATTVGATSCKQMFSGCRGITTAQAVLPALTLANSSYYSMYENCSKLVAAPAIMATTVDVDSCRSMFNGCSSLTTASSSLPATTLANRCYQNMFVNCSGMTTAPELPALTLVTDCYNNMFNGCKSLNNIKCLATDISATGCTNNWVQNVASTGVFIKNSLMSSWTSGSSGIPSSWTVHDDDYVTVTGVTVSPASTTVDKGSTTALTATVLPHNANDQQVTWSTSDSSVATVDTNGVVTAVGCGSANIIVTTHELGYTAQCAVSVEKHVTKVDLDTYVLTINTGGTYQLTPTVTPSDACDPSVTWSTSDASIASVDTNGVVSGVTTGSATVTVTTVDGGFSKNCSVTVNEGTHVTGVTLSDAAITVTANTTYTLTATVTPADAANKNVTWSSSDDAIATVDSNGVVSGVAKGNATITVTTVDGGFTAQCSVTVATYGYFTLRSLADNNTFTIKNNGTSAARNFSYSLDSGNTWSSFTLNNNATWSSTTINSGDTIMMKGSNTRLGSSWQNGCYFRGSQNYEVEGNISSLLNNNDIDVEIPTGNTFHFAQMFSGDTKLVNAENLKILSTTLYESSFNGFFRGCTNLQKAPDLSIPTTLGKETYSSMFEGCVNLSQPPAVLSATTAELSSYKRMFCMNRNSKVTTQMTKSPLMIGNFGSETNVAKDFEVFKGNGSLTEVKCFWTNNSGSFGNLANWMTNVSSSGTFYKRSTQTFNLNSANGIPSGWNIMNDDNTGN